MLDGGTAAAKAAMVLVPVETIFDSGRPAAADEGLFSDFEASGHEEDSPAATPLMEVKVESPPSPTPTPALPICSGQLPHLVPAVSSSYLYFNFASWWGPSERRWFILVFRSCCRK